MAFLRFVGARSSLDWALPVSMAAWVVSRRVLATDLTLTHLPDRSLGLPAVLGIDVAQRTLLWPRMILLFGSIVLFYWAGAWAASRLAARGRAVAATRWSAAMVPAQYLAMLSLASLIAGPAASERRDLQTILLSWALAAALAASIDRVLHARAWRRPSPASWTAWLLAAWCLAYFDTVVRKHWPTNGAYYLLDGWLATVPVLVALPYLTGRLRTRAARGWLQAVAVPLLALPAAGLVAQEVGYALVTHDVASPTLHGLALVVGVALVLLALGLVLLAALRIRPPSILHRPGLLHLPLIVFVTSVVANLRPAGSPVTIDWFHMGETLLPAHQLVRFGSLPYADIMPTHGILPNYLGGISSWLLNGRITADGEALGRVLMASLAALAVYALVRRISGSALFAAFVVLLLPAIMPMPGAVWLTADVYAIGLVGVLAFADALARGRVLRFGLVVAAMLAVRHDIGMFFVALAAVFCAVYAALGRRDPRRLASVVLRVLGPSIAVVTLVAVVVYARNGSLQNLRILRRFLSLDFQSLTLGYSPVFRDVDAWVGFTMFFLPALTVAGAMAAMSRAARQWIECRRIDVKSLSLTALVAYNLFVMTRVWTRHTEFESPFFAYSMTVLVVLLLADELGRPHREPLRALVVAAVVALAAPGTQVSRAEAMLRATSYASLDRARALSPISLRYRVDAKEVLGFAELRRLINELCGATGTFLDVSHSPLLYSLLDRRFPGYVVPLFYVSSETMQRDALSRLAAGDVRLAIVDKMGWWPHDVDAVPDSVRSYRILEFMHDRFPENRQLLSFVVAVPGTSGGSASDGGRVARAEFSELGYLPGLWARSEVAAPAGAGDDLLAAARRAAGVGDADAVILSPRSRLRIPMDLAPTPTATVMISIAQEAPLASLAFRYQKEDLESPSGIGFTTVAGSASYALRPSGQWAWWGDRRRVVAIELENRSDVPLELRGLRIESEG